MTDQGSPSGLGSPDVSAMMEQLAQQKAQGGKSGLAGGAANASPAAGMSGSSFPGSPGMGQGNQAGQPPKNPRGFVGPVQELKNFGNDALEAAVSFMPPFMQNIFRPTLHDTPEQAQKKKQMLQKYQQLNSEQQQYAQARIKERQQKEQQELQEKQAKKQREEQQAQSEIAMPQGKVRGDAAGGGNSNKRRTMQKLQDDRTKTGSAGQG